MADLHILGKVSREEHPFFDDEYWFYIGRVENGDDEAYVSCRRGANAIENAMFLWDLVNSERRKAYYEFLRNEIKVGRNELDSGGYLVSVEQAKKLLDLIDDIDEKIEKFVDVKGRILTEHLTYIGERIYLPTLENGKKDRDSLRDSLEQAQIIKGFLQEAIELNYPLSIG